MSVVQVTMKIQLNARNCAHQFQSGADERILLAGLRQAIGLPYECGSGTCGTCKARLISGEIERSWPEAPGTKYLKARDEFLMCQCTARTDCPLEVTNFVTPFDAATFVPRHRAGRITGIELLTGDVMRVKVTTDTPMDFAPGQTVGGLEVLITRRLGEISGAVANDRGEPVLDATVVAFPADHALWRPGSRHIKTGRPNQQGIFTIDSLPPGDYLAAAVQVLEAGQAYDPDFLEAISPAATRVSIAQGQTRQLKLSLMSR